MPGIMDESVICELCGKVFNKDDAKKVSLIDGFKEVHLCKKCLEKFQSESIEKRRNALYTLYPGNEKRINEFIKKMPGYRNPSDNSDISLVLVCLAILAVLLVVGIIAAPL